MNRKKVVFVHRVTCDYSKAFFIQLHAALLPENIEFFVVSGSPWKHEALLDILDDLPFGVRCENKKIFGPLIWSKNALIETWNADFIIFEQLNSSLHLYPFIVRRWIEIAFQKVLGIPRRHILAFWGHGKNLSCTRRRLFIDWWKRFITRNVDWWFAYTELSKDIVLQSGFPIERITVFENSVDTHSLRQMLDSLTKEKLAKMKWQLFGLAESKEDNSRYEPIGVFCARLIPLKLIPFLLESLDIIHFNIPSFKMIIIGDGVERDRVREFCRSRKWCIYTGALYGVQKVQHLALSDIWLNPGLAGLSIVESFALGIPFATTDNGMHSPEICYLRSGINGIIAKPEVNSFAEAVSTLIIDQETMAQMKRNSKQDGNKYSVEQMVMRVKEGILKCQSEIKANTVND